MPSRSTLPEVPVEAYRPFTNVRYGAGGGRDDSDTEPFRQIPRGPCLPVDFVAAVTFDGAEFKGIAIDRRPLLSGGQATITSIQFSIGGAEIQAVVDPVLIDSPSSFGWGTRTFDWSGPIRSESVNIVDLGGAPLSQWPC